MKNSARAKNEVKKRFRPYSVWDIKNSRRTASAVCITGGGYTKCTNSDNTLNALIVLIVRKTLRQGSGFPRHITQRTGYTKSGRHTKCTKRTISAKNTKDVKSTKNTKCIKNTGDTRKNPCAIYTTSVIDSIITIDSIYTKCM